MGTLVGEGDGRHVSSRHTETANRKQERTLPEALITGANRGIGLEFARQLLNEDWSVVATCRHPEGARELEGLRRRFPDSCEVRPLSVTDWEGITALAGDLRGRSLRLLLNNAGTRPMEAYSLGEIDPDAFMEAVRVNALGALKVTEAFVPHLTAAAESVVAMVSSNLGSIARNEAGGDYAYRASKAAMNAVMRSLAMDLKGRGITVISLHPGWVRTRMGGDHARLSVSESVAGMREVLSRISLRDSGRFLRYDGFEEAW
jgi:NAD(P)-dependent dehydrogenase (short-subunit alcohol dehydrogenase family)